MKKARFGIGLILGAAAGMFAGILAAPKSGKETREELKRKSEEAKEMAADKVEEVKECAEDAKERVARVAKTTRHAVDEEIEELKAKKTTHGNKK